METFLAILQIFILYLVIYAILKSARGSRFGQVLMALGLLITVLFSFMYLFHFHVLATILSYLLGYLAISSVVIFQPEIRRILATIGALHSTEKNNTYRRTSRVSAEAFTEILAELSSRRLGALFAFENGISLRSYEDSGVRTDAIITRELIISLFTPPLPLHDGGTVVRNGRLSSAHCIFPLSNNPELTHNGMRHRAAVGLSEETDALVVVVSEESGTISVAYNGRLYRYEGPSAAASTQRWVSRILESEARTRRWYHVLTDTLQRLLFKPSTPNKEEPSNEA